MGRPLELDELVEFFTLLPDEIALLRNKSGATRLGFALLLKFLTHRGRFPSGRAELPGEAVEFVAKQVRVPAGELGFYDWSGGTVKAAPAEIRAVSWVSGSARCRDADKLTGWLAEHVCEAERRTIGCARNCWLAAAGSGSSRRRRSRAERIVAVALRQAEQTLTRPGPGRSRADVAARLEMLVEVASTMRRPTSGGPSVLALIKSDPGNVSLESMLTEIDKLRAVRAVGLPGRACSPTSRRRWWPGGVRGRRWSRRRICASTRSGEADAARGAAAHPGTGDHRHPGGAADLHGAPDQRPRGKAGHPGTDQRVQEGHRQGEHPVRHRRGVIGRAGRAWSVTVVYPAVTGGEQTLRELVHEFKTTGPVYRRTVQTTLQGLLHQPLPARADRAAGGAGVPVSNNTTHRPVLDALELIGRYAGAQPDLLPRSVSTSRSTRAVRRLGGRWS